VANVVYMGIGEPLANYTNTLRSLRILNHEEGLQIGMRHIAVSTCGLVSGMRRLARERLPLRLAVSLHAPCDDLRSELVPINRVHPLGQLLDACREYQTLTARRITFEYCLIEGVNDSVALAHDLGRLLSGRSALTTSTGSSFHGYVPRGGRDLATEHGIHSLVNLIPLNAVEGYAGQRPPMFRVLDFQRTVQQYGIKATIRQEMGVDIDAACGQLRQKASQHMSGRKISAERLAMRATAPGRGAPGRGAPGPPERQTPDALDIVPGEVVVGS